MFNKPFICVSVFNNSKMTNKCTKRGDINPCLNINGSPDGSCWFRPSGKFTVLRDVDHEFISSCSSGRHLGESI